MNILLWRRETPLQNYLRKIHNFWPIDHLPIRLVTSHPVLASAVYIHIELRQTDEVQLPVSDRVVRI